jgi:hypothetical protein
MQTGRFYYFDNPNIGIGQRIFEAADNYFKTTGQIPDLALINPRWLKLTLLNNVIYKGKDIEVAESPIIQKNIVYIGIGSKE